MATHSSTLAWKIPWMEEPDRLQSMGLLRVEHDWVTSFSLLCIGEGNDNAFQCSCLENPRDGAAWWAAVYGVAQSQTRLKQLSSSSSSSAVKTSNMHVEFPDSSGVNTRHLYCEGLVLIPGWETKISPAVRCYQKQNNNNKKMN